MPTLDISIPQFKPEDLDDERQRRRILGYLSSLNEQLRYVLNNLDEDNLSQVLTEVINSKADVTQINEMSGNVERLTTQIIQTANEIALKASKDEVNALGQRVSSAESSITTQAWQIASKASRETVDALTGRVTAAESEIRQTPDMINMAVRSTEHGSNLMIGTENTASIAKKEESASIFYTYGADYPDKLLRIENGTDQEFSIYATITNLKAGQTYTFSVDVINFGNDIRLSVAGLYSDWQTWDNSVRRLSFTFVATGATHNPHVICRRRSGGDGYFDVRKFKIELGSTATAWRKSDEEFRAGSSVEITRDEVRFDTDKFSVHTGDAGDMAIDKDGMSIGNITATRSLTAPNVAYRLNGGTYHVGSGKAYATLDQVFAEINDRTLTESVSIYIDDPVVYGGATLEGVSGSGEVFIYGQGHTWVGNSTISECNSYVRFDKLTIQGTSGTNGMNVSCCKFVKFVDTIFDGNNKLSEASLHIVASRVDLSNVDVYRSPYHLYAEYSTLSTDNLKGGESGTSWMRGHDNVMTVRASKPLGTMDGTRCIVMPDLGTVAVNAGKSVNPQQEAVTVTLSPIDWRYHYGSWSADKPSQLYQGMYGSDKYRAVYWFSNSGLSGKTIKTATLTLTRISGSGSGAAIDIHLWGTPLALASGNPTTNRQDYGIIGKLAYGETKEFTIPLTAAQAFAAGSIKALMIDSNESVINSRGYSDNYGKLESAVIFKLTY